MTAAVLALASAAPPTSAQGEQRSVPSGVFDSLTTLNKKLANLLKDLKADRLDTGLFIREINRIERVKHEMVEDDFGDQRVFGLPFKPIYLGLEQIDVLLWRGAVLFDKGEQGRAESKIEAAKKAKDRLEARLRGGSDVPRGAFASLTTLSKKLANLLKDLKADRLDTGLFIREINRIERVKHEMVEDDFGDQRVFGLPFKPIYLGLEQIDVLLWRGAVLFDKGEQGRAESKIEAAKKAKDRLEAKLRGTPPPPPPPSCTSTLERSPGGGNFTANNHIRVAAICDRPVTEIAVISLSGDTFDACAQTLGTATTCSATGELLDTGWNAPADELLEAYGRVTANADGNYRVRIRGAGAVLLHQYDATVP